MTHGKTKKALPFRKALIIFAPPTVTISKQFIEDLHVLWKLEPHFQHIINNANPPPLYV